MLKIESFTRVKNDINGNPRYVIHFLQVANRYDEALAICKKLGGSRYRAKNYGGGIVFQSYSVENLIGQLNDLIKSKQ